MNLGRMITTWAMQRPERPAVHFEGSRIAYRELEQRIISAARDARRPGGDRVVGGLNILLLPLLYVGAAVILHPRFDPALLLRAIEARRPTLLLLVPATIIAALAQPRWAQADLSSLRMINTGSSVVPLSLIRAWHERGIPVGQVYGATETCPIATCLRAEEPLRKAP